MRYNIKKLNFKKVSKFNDVMLYSTWHYVRGLQQFSTNYRKVERNNAFLVLPYNWFYDNLNF